MAVANLSTDYVDPVPSPIIHIDELEVRAFLYGSRGAMRGEDVPRLLDHNMIASTDVRLVTRLTAHAGAR